MHTLRNILVVVTAATLGLQAQALALDTEPELGPAPTASVFPLPSLEQPYEPEVIHEDDPRWDCPTMGNMICGTTTTVYFPKEASTLTPSIPAAPVQAQPSFTG